MSDYATLLLPPDFQEAVLYGGSEIIQKEVFLASPSSSSSSVAKQTTTLHLHLLDEEERHELLKSDSLSPALRRTHEQHLQRLEAARRLLREEDRLQQWLTCPADPSFWPAASLLEDAGNVVAVLKEVTDPSEAVRQSVAELKQAIQLLRQEATLPGLYTFAPATVSGVLTPYVAMPSPVSSGVWRQCPSCGVAGTPLYRLQPSRRLLSSAEVVDLPLTAKAVTQLVGLLQVPGRAAEVPDRRDEWRQLARLHRCRLVEGRPMMGTVQEMLRSWGMTPESHGTDRATGEEHLATRLHRAKEKQRCVRLQVGVYATVLHQHSLLLLFLKAEKDALGRSRTVPGYTLVQEPQGVLERVLTPVQVGELEKQLYMTLSEALLRGLLRVLARPISATSLAPTDEELERAVRTYFLSPVTDESLAWRSCCSCQPLPFPPSDTSVAVQAFRVKADHNPFVIFHGSGVEGGCEGRHEVLAGMKRRRDELLERQTEEALRQEALNRVASGSTSTAASPLSTADRGAGDGPKCTLVGAELRMAVESTVIKVLSQRPLSKAELIGHPSLQLYKSSPNFEPVIKAVLKEHAEYRSKRYELRE